MKWGWLQNPAVALTELLASAIAVAQSAAWLCRCIGRLQTEAENERYRRARLGAATTALAVAIATSAVTWPVITAEAAKDGNHGLMNVSYPLLFCLLALLAPIILLEQARTRQRFSPSACCLLAVTLATMATGYFLSSGPDSWIGSAATSAAPNLGILAMVCMFTRYLRRVQPAQPKDQTQPR